MDRLEEVKKACQKDIPDDEKIKILNDMLLDLKNEMDAESENMHPDVRKKLGEAYSFASKCIMKFKK